MAKKIPLFLFSALLFLGFVSCENKTEYQKLVERQYQKGAGNDSLFLDYHFGMTKEEFYDHSWKLNKKKIVREGGTNQSVRYEVTGLKSRAKKNFFPVFHQDSMYSMPVKYSYTGWAPWNRNLWADSLEQDILKVFQQKYNNEFKKMKHPGKDKMAYILINGNKRISIFQMDDQHVGVVYTDLDVLNRLEKK